ncbi:helix-turn-helix domain-containing protein [Candidatus Bathyarchaeota archaeon]|nr:helix-turn-helix domain-containing protein [Candidatus Bathyarchaeota archaeon]NIV44150.1 helix-turn-helix domain-containing protein [Candidatus Bathyarchaeota archaeon]
MSRRRKLGTRVLKAVSSSIRLRVLTILLERGPLSYTEIMTILRLNPSRDAGRFAYHLKSLLKADLIEPDVKTKKYRLTDLGRMLIDVAETIEERFFKRRKMMVRASRLAMEEFDRNKIAESLVKEANVPHDLAQKIARETQGRLLKIKTKYLTAPLIREFVNTILIEKGLEEYRHKLTRLGLPIHDVTQLIKIMGTQAKSVGAVHEAAANSIIEEYTLLNVLPRDIADAHLSGSLHLDNLGYWILKPIEFTHDLRFFLQRGLSFERPSFANLSYPPPKSFRAALLVVSHLLRAVGTEVVGEQTVEYLNIFLAPFIRGVGTDQIREDLRLFLFDLNHSLAPDGKPLHVSLGLEFVVPSFLQAERAIAQSAKSVGSYADFAEESRRLLSLLLDVVMEESRGTPIFNPSFILKIRPEVLASQECDSMLFEAHRLAADRGLPYFANLASKDQKCASYTATGMRLSDDWKKDWELDTLRTGSVDSVVVNLPRLVYEAKRNETEFFNLLNEQLEMALRALEIKYRTLKQRLRDGLLPFLARKAGGDRYVRLENFSRQVSPLGLNEAAKCFVGESILEADKALQFAENTMQYFSDFIRKYARKPETRSVLAMVPCYDAAKRLAELDVERYGWANARPQGAKEHPFYTDMVAVPSEADISWQERLRIEERFHTLAMGGHLAIMQLAEKEQDPEELLAVTRQIAATYRIGLYSFNRSITCCGRCQKAFFGQLLKCPSCGSVNAMIRYRRVSARYEPTVVSG